MAKVQIDINAKDNASAVLRKVGTELEKTGTKGGRSFKDMVKGADSLTRGITGLSLASIGVAGAIGGAVKAAEKAIGEYSAYAESVDKMSMSTGMAADETSRLIQLADDFRVDQTALTTAMKMALQNGFEPTVENLANLSDEYKSMTSATERAEKMQKIFGRQWADMVPLLDRGGAAIRAANDGIADSLIVTQDAIEANRNYIKAMDDLQDSFAGFKYELVTGAIPSLTKLLELLSSFNADNAAEFLNTFFKGTFLESDQSKKASVYAERMNAVADAYKLTGGAAKDMVPGVEAAGSALDEAAKKTEKSTDNMDFWIERGQEQANTAKRSAVEIKNLSDAQALYNAQADLFTEASQRAVEAQQTFNMEFGDKTVSKLEQAGIKGEDYEAALGLIDKRLGTQYLAEKKANDELDRAIQKYKETGSIEDFDKALGENKDTWAELDGNLQAARQGLDDARTAFDAFILDIARYNGMEVKINVRTQTYGSNVSGGRVTGTTLGGNDPAEEMRAAGGPVMGGRAYLVGEQGPEVLYMPYNGYVQPHGGPVGAYSNGQGGGARNVTYNIFSVERPGRIQTALKISELMGGAA